MAQQDVLLSGTEHEKQRVEYVCGAATANMILSFWDKQQPQEQVWTAIQQNTGTQARPLGAPSMEGEFWNQYCDSCSQAQGSGSGFNCWYTTPEALVTTLNDFSPASFVSEYHPYEDACKRLAESLTGPDALPAAFTKAANLHWSAAVGYQLNGPSTGIPWTNGNVITALYVRDPATEDPGTDIIHLLTTDGLQRPIDGLLMAVICGVQAGKYPIVVRSAAPNDSFWRLLATSWLGVKLFKPWLSQRWIPKKRTRPTPPPPPRT
jgi:hypothetical protein